MKKILCLLILLIRLILVCLHDHLPEPDIEIRRQGKNALPPNLIPQIYNLNLFTVLFGPEFKFHGDVTIKVSCDKKTTEIVLFAKKITVNLDKVAVELLNTDGSKSEMKIAKRQYQQINELLVIVLEDELLVGNTYEIYIEFENIPMEVEEPIGYYSMKYGGYYNNREKLAINYFDSIHARQTFPCFDQMNLKAKFKITHVHEKAVRGFSNMKQLSSTSYGSSTHEVKDVYEDSVPMSPYLVAIALVNYTSRKRRKFSKNAFSRKKILEIWADDPDDDELKFLGDMAVHAFKFHSKRFKVPYALDVLNILIIPHYETWAEEKYGLIVLNESFLLSAVDSSNDEMKFNIALNVCQVIGQQWIGTYTTMSWWDEYWFHQALLLFNGVQCVEKALPGSEKLYFRKRAINSFKNSLKFDAEIRSVPMMPQSGNKFDKVDKFIRQDHMEKAHQLFRTMNFFLGEKVFKLCVTNYLKKFKFGTSNLDQVWEVFTKTANAAKMLPTKTNMRAIMNRFIFQRGYPLIRVQINAERNRITFTQKRFILPETNERIVDGTCWIIPILLTTKKKSTRSTNKVPTRIRHWMRCNDSELSIDIRLAHDEWILLNFPLGVLCRVDYDENNWTSLGKTLRNEEEYDKIDEISRIRLILDMFELSKVGELPYQIVFENLLYVRHEMYYFAWTEAMEKFREFRLYLIGTDAIKPYETYVEKIIKPVFTMKEFRKIDAISRKNHLEFLHKISVVTNACDFNVGDCRRQSKEIFDKHFNELVNAKTVDPLRSIRKTVLCEGIRHGDKTVWNLLFEHLYYTQNEHHLYSDILMALACSKEPEIIKEYLIWSITDKITTKGSVIVFRSLSHNEIAYKFMKNFFLEKFSFINHFFLQDTSSFQEYIRILFGATMNEDDLTQLNELIHSKKVELENFRIVIQQCQAEAARNVQWLKRNKEDMDKLFEHMFLTWDLLR